MNKSIKLLILSLIICLSLALEITGISLKFGTSYAYVVKPLLWIFIGAIAFIFFKNDVVVNKKYKKEVDFCVIVATLIYFLIYFIIGYVKGFAHNPYDRSLYGIFINIWTFLPVVIVEEYVRYYMINNCSKKKILLWTLLIAFLFTLVDLNIFKFDSYFSNTLTTLEFFMQTLIPKLITNLFLTYISYFCGYGTAILYSLLPQLALYVLPILPDVDWATLALLNAIIPFFTYVYINYRINKIDKTLRRNVDKAIGIKGWLIMMGIVIVMMCFGLGLFPISPLVIASNSMAPKIHRGDIVLIEDKDVNKVKKGDIIRYRMEGYYVVHRVLKITTDKNGKLQFITKGDNNRDLDLFPVKESQYAGTIKFNIPFVGYPTLLLNEMLNPNQKQEVKVETGNK